MVSTISRRSHPTRNASRSFVATRALRGLPRAIRKARLERRIPNHHKGGTMNDRTKQLLFLVAGTALFVATSLVHAGILASGFEHARAMVAEGVIAVVLGIGLLASLIWPAYAAAV